MSRFLEELAAFAKQQPFPVIRFAEIVGDGEPETVDLTATNRCQNVYSVAKAFCVTAIGILWDRGLVRLEDKVCDILADELPAEGVDERWRLCTVEMALAHQVGLPGGFLDIDVTQAKVFGTDFLRYLFTYPLLYTPGTDSIYTDGAYYLISRIAEKIAGLPLDDFIWREIGVPLEFEELAWSHCPQGHAIGATGLYISAADMAKLGALYLGRGTYQGHCFFSPEWADTVFAKRFSFDPHKTGKYYAKGGMNGQKLYVIPCQNRVVAMQSFGGNTEVIGDWICEYRD